MFKSRNLQRGIATWAIVAIISAIASGGIGVGVYLSKTKGTSAVVAYLNGISLAIDVAVPFVSASGASEEWVQCLSDVSDKVSLSATEWNTSDLTNVKVAKILGYFNNVSWPTSSLDTQTAIYVAAIRTSVSILTLYLSSLQPDSADLLKTTSEIKVTRGDRGVLKNILIMEKSHQAELKLCMGKGVSR